MDEDSEPLAMLVNPQPFAVEMCSACETCYDQREYRKLEQRDDKTRICTCGAHRQPSAQALI